MSRNLIILIIIFAVLIGLAMFVLIPDRGGGEEAPEVVDPVVAAQQTAEAAVAQGGQGAVDPLQSDGKVLEIREIDGRQVQLNFIAERQFETQSERNGFVPRPGDVTIVVPTPVPDVTTPVDQVAPTLTPVPQGDQVAPTGRSGEPIIFQSITVAPGETMYSVSIRTDFDTSIGLMALHGIDAGDFSQGNVLNIPIVNPAYCVNARAAHLILEGENVFRIAQKYGVTKESIQAANGLGPDFFIKTNEVLCIP